MYRCLSLILWLCATTGYGAFIEIHDRPNLLGLLHEDYWSEFEPRTCEVVSKDETLIVKGASLVTDTCIMIYENSDCSGLSMQLRPGSYPNISSLIPSDWDSSKVFRAYGDCYKSPDPSLSIALFKNSNRESPLITYDDACSCITPPDHIRSKIRSLDNSNRCIALFPLMSCAVFSEENKPLVLRAGVSAKSLDLGPMSIGSIRFCDIDPACERVFPEVIGFKLTGAVPVLDPNPSDFIDQLVDPAIYRNKAGKPVTEEYSAEKQIDEVISIEIPKFTNIKPFTPGAVINIETNEDFPVFAKSRIAAALKEAYNDKSYSEKETFYFNPQTKFGVKQTIEVDTCSTMKINSRVTQLREYKVGYEVIVRLTGEAGLRYSKPMSASKLSYVAHDAGFIYVRDDGENAGIARAVSELTATIGVEVVVDLKDEPNNCA